MDKWAAFGRLSKHGGNLREIPRPHVRFFSPKNPKKVKREVTASVLRYWGGGTHYYVKLQEESNPIWNSTEELWQYPWDDGPRGRGRKFEKKFNNILAARQFVKKKMKVFPVSTHKLLDDWDNLMPEDTKLWCGRFKDGD